MDKDAYWWEVVQKRWTFKAEDLPKKAYVAVPLYKEEDRGAVSVVVANHREKDWIFACKMVEVHKKGKFW
jgi:hypothetical protein